MSSPLLGIAVALFIALMFFVFGLLFKKKSKFVRYITWIIAGLLVVGIISNPFVKNKVERDREQLIIGLYRLETSNSTFGNLTLSNYSDLTFQTRANNTFVVSKTAPFLISDQGKWNLVDNSDISFIELSFDGKKESFQLANDGSLTFEAAALKNGKSKDKIIFRR